jgi:hypothetical protein
MGSHEVSLQEVINWILDSIDTVSLYNLYSDSVLSILKIHLKTCASYT